MSEQGMMEMVINLILIHKSLERAHEMNHEQVQVNVGEKTTKNEDDGNDIQEKFDDQSLENIEKQSDNQNP